MTASSSVDDLIAELKARGVNVTVQTGTLTELPTPAPLKTMLIKGSAIVSIAQGHAQKLIVFEPTPETLRALSEAHNVQHIIEISDANGEFTSTRPRTLIDYHHHATIKTLIVDFA